MKNPCVGCGACCSFFRVSFYQGELKSVGGTVPDEYVIQISPFRGAMKGTETSKNTRCVKLSGDVGYNASCSMYQDRPTPCREFSASYENGIGEKDDRCDKARVAHGLAPLTINDWN